MKRICLILFMGLYLIGNVVFADPGELDRKESESKSNIDRTNIPNVSNDKWERKDDKFYKTLNTVNNKTNQDLNDETVINAVKVEIEECKCSTTTPAACDKGNPEDSVYDSETKTTTRVCGGTSCNVPATCTLKDTEYAPAKQTLGIGLSPECLVHGGCSLDVYKTLGIRENSPKETRTSVLSLFQDAIGAATFFIGTIVTIAFVWAGFKFVLAGRNGDSSGRSSAQQGMIYAIIGLILVMSSYAIIRLVQYIASTQ